MWESCEDDSSALLAWDFSSGSFVWERFFEMTLQSLSKDDTRIFAGGVGFVSALNPSDGSVLWVTEIDGMAKTLTLILHKSDQKRTSVPFPDL